MTDPRVLKMTYIGGPTVLIEYGSLRILTDPTFDPPGESSLASKKRPNAGLTSRSGMNVCVIVNALIC